MHFYLALKALMHTNKRRKIKFSRNSSLCTVSLKRQQSSSFIFKPRLSHIHTDTHQPLKYVSDMKDV